MNSRTMICTVVGLLAVMCVLMVAPRASFSPKGIILPSQSAIRAPIAADQVHIYHQSPTTNFKELGLVRIEFRATQIDTDAQNTLFQKVKTLAASVGANGVIVNLFEPNVSEVGPLITFWGTAIYVPNQPRSAN